MIVSSRQRGFTLVEILIVISVIAILLTMIAGTVILAQKKAQANAATTLVNNLSASLDHYYSDEGFYPGAEYKDVEENAFPALFNALCTPPKSKGGLGGRSAPYYEPKERDILVRDEDKGENDYRQATADEISDNDVKKYIKDPWGLPLWFRENKSKKRHEFMHRVGKADIWSTGVNKRNDTNGEEGSDDDKKGEQKNDDLGNW